MMMNHSNAPQQQQQQAAAAVAAAAAAAVASGKPQKGWLARWTRKHWSRHWFVLKNGSLAYYRGPAAELCSFLDGVLDLSLIKRIEVQQVHGSDNKSSATHRQANHQSSSAQQQQQHYPHNYAQNNNNSSSNNNNNNGNKKNSSSQQQQQQPSDANFRFSLKMWSGECHLLAATTAAERSVWLEAINVYTNGCDVDDEAATDSASSTDSSPTSNLSALSMDIGVACLAAARHYQQQQEQMALDQLALKLKSAVNNKRREKEEALIIQREEDSSKENNGQKDNEPQDVIVDRQEQEKQTLVESSQISPPTNQQQQQQITRDTAMRHSKLLAANKLQREQEDTEEALQWPQIKLPSNNQVPLVERHHDQASLVRANNQVKESMISKEEKSSQREELPVPKASVEGLAQQQHKSSLNLRQQEDLPLISAPCQRLISGKEESCPARGLQLSEACSGDRQAFKRQLMCAQEDGEDAQGELSKHKQQQLQQRDTNLSGGQELSEQTFRHHQADHVKGASELIRRPLKPQGLNSEQASSAPSWCPLRGSAKQVKQVNVKCESSTGTPTTKLSRAEEELALTKRIVMKSGEEIEGSRQVQSEPLGGAASAFRKTTTTTSTMSDELETQPGGSVELVSQLGGLRGEVSGDKINRPAQKKRVTFDLSTQSQLADSSGDSSPGESSESETSDSEAAASASEPDDLDDTSISSSSSVSSKASNSSSSSPSDSEEITESEAPPGVAQAKLVSSVSDLIDLGTDYDHDQDEDDDGDDDNDDVDDDDDVDRDKNNRNSNNQAEAIPSGPCEQVTGTSVAGQPLPALVAGKFKGARQELMDSSAPTSPQALLRMGAQVAVAGTSSCLAAASGGQAERMSIGALEAKLSDSYASFGKLEQSYKRLQEEHAKGDQLHQVEVAQLRARVHQLTLELSEARSRLLDYEQRFGSGPAHLPAATPTSPRAATPTRLSRLALGQAGGGEIISGNFSSTAGQSRASALNWALRAGQQVAAAAAQHKQQQQAKHHHHHLEQEQPLLLMEHVKQTLAANQQTLGLKLLNHSKQIQRKLNELELKVDRIQYGGRSGRASAAPPSVAN